MLEVILLTALPPVFHSACRAFFPQVSEFGPSDSFTRWISLSGKGFTPPEGGDWLQPRPFLLLVQQTTLHHRHLPTPEAIWTAVQQTPPVMRDLFLLRAHCTRGAPGSFRPVASHRGPRPTGSRNAHAGHRNAIDEVRSQHIGPRCYISLN